MGSSGNVIQAKDSALSLVASWPLLPTRHSEPTRPLRKRDVLSKDITGKESQFFPGLGMKPSSCRRPQLCFLLGRVGAIAEASSGRKKKGPSAMRFVAPPSNLIAEMGLRLAK